MIQFSRMQLMRASGCALVVFALALAGCDREQIKVQQVPKDADQGGTMPVAAQTASPGMAENPHAGMDMAGMTGGGAQPQV